MRNKKRWIITGAAALLLAVGGTTALVVAAAAPVTHEETLKRTEDKFGKPPAPPAGDALKEQLAKVEATMQAKPSEDPQKTTDDWQKAELLKQQIIFAEHAPSPMPTGHDSVVVAGKQP
ncbi:hypothetical protein [Arthrobacter sp. ES1]|uniref:hypothetical protein n=1 Tax=Arthrobacter sp. ES1 TaxID=1897056 RepID=UPI001CFFE01B|nr:hypothetical protein [Arthrobacter sp. ES1]MCB5280334.1 hypothetical protein [Arthrobacter sp. ES1]